MEPTYTGFVASIGLLRHSRAAEQVWSTWLVISEMLFPVGAAANVGGR
jgi:nitrate reductase NapE component